VNFALRKDFTIAIVIARANSKPCFTNGYCICFLVKQCYRDWN